MNVSLYQAAAALDGNDKWQQIISENLAASSTPAFKKSEIAFSSVVAGMMSTGSDPLTAQHNPTLLPRPTIGTDFAPGSLIRTGSPTSLALEGPGFFAVKMPDGNLRYTRDGEFRVNLLGEVRNKDGFELVSEGGSPIIVNPRNKDNISVSPQGEVGEGGVMRGKLSLFEFTDRSQLTPLGNGYFIPPPNVQAAPATETTVAQGLLEQSNVTPMVEVGNLLLALRNYEANQKVIQASDERMGRAIQELSATT